MQVAFCVDSQKIRPSTKPEMMESARALVGGVIGIWRYHLPSVFTAILWSSTEIKNAHLTSD